jgi:hypothetical protein
MLKLLSAVLPALSVTLRVNVDVVSVVGDEDVPVIAPVDPFKDAPVGNEPEKTAYDTMPPPDSLSVAATVNDIDELALTLPNDPDAVVHTGADPVVKAESFTVDNADAFVTFTDKGL